MSAPTLPDRPAAGASRSDATDLTRAWVGVGLIPVAFAAAMVIGEGLVSILGYPSGGDTEAPLWVALLVGVPLTLVGVAPGVIAVVHGRRAFRAGRRSGRVAAVIGGLVSAYWILVTVLGVGARLL